MNMVKDLSCVRVLPHAGFPFSVVENKVAHVSGQTQH